MHECMHKMYTGVCMHKHIFLKMKEEQNKTSSGGKKNHLTGEGQSTAVVTKTLQVTLFAFFPVKPDLGKQGRSVCLHLPFSRGGGSLPMPRQT